VNIAVSSFIQRIARGKHGAENLSRHEARDALLDLFGGSDELQLGAFLIGQRMKGESAAEIAGFTEAARSLIPGYHDLPCLEKAVDLPCYAGKRRAAHAHLLAALQARDEGISVLVHGVDAIPGRISAWQMLQAAGVQRAQSLADASTLLDRDGIAYLDLAEMCPPLFRLYHLRQRLGVRTFANSVARLLNPLRCAGQLNGIFHTPYAQTMAEANAMLGQPRALIFNGAEGEPELYCDRQKIVLKQNLQEIERIGMPDMGCEPYPRQARDDLSRLLQDNQRMKGGDLTPREQAVLKLMHDAFLWAGRGDLPVYWKVQQQEG